MRISSVQNDPATAVDGPAEVAAAPRPGVMTACEDGFAYRIDAGRADLFVDEIGQAGTLRLLASLGAGEAAFGVPATGVRLLLAPGDGASLTAIAVECLAGQPGTLARWADIWVSRIADHARHMPHPLQQDAGSAKTELPPSRWLDLGRNELAAGTVATAQAPLWCRCVSGNIRSVWARAAGPDDPPVPVLRAAPLHVAADSTAIALTSLELAREGTLAGALEAFNATLGRRMQAWRDSERDRTVRRAAAVAGRDAATLTAAMAELGAHATAVPDVPPVDLEPPLAAAMRAVAAAAGVRLPADFARGLAAGNDEEALALLAASAGLRVRAVRLHDGWWRSAGEAMVGRLGDGAPVALLPVRRGWRMVGPGGESVAVDSAVAASLAGHGEVLYRGFEGLPDRPGRALLAFVFATARREMALIGLVSLLAGILAMATPFLSGILVQSVIPDGVRNEILQLVLAMVAISLGVMGFELVRGLALLRIESVLGSSLEAALWNRLLRLSPGFFRGYSAGDLALRADAVNQIRRTVSVTTVTALIGVVFSFANLVVLFSYGLQPALLALAVCAVQLAILSGMALFDVAIQRRALANSGVMQTLTVQIVQGMSKLRVAAAENRFLARWMHLFAVDQALHFRSSVVGSGVSAFGAGWNILVMAAVIALVGFGDEKMSLGDYVTYSGVFGQFVSAALSLVGIIPALATVIPLRERARPILTEPTEDAGGSVQPGTLRGDIEMAQVTFGYPGGPPVLRDVSLQVPAGAHVAIVGPSGSGKSSLMRLLLGFEKPDSGAVLLDGHDLRDLDVTAIRRQFGVVLQHGRIEAGSLYHNIAGAAPLSLAEAADAARLAGLADDIAAMPMGLHTYVDDSGATLSGGQRQRLLLARAIARRPRIMLMDEATSALDNATQAHVMQTLARMNVTRIVVAHRLSTVRSADTIYVLSEGRVVERGDYQTLAAAGGLFAELIRRQMT